MIPIPKSLRRSAHKLQRSLLLERPVSAVYFLIRNSDVIYIGQSTDLAARISDHFKTRTFDGAFFLPVEPDRLEEEELRYLKKIKPRDNDPRTYSPRAEATVKRRRSESRLRRQAFARLVQKTKKDRIRLQLDKRQIETDIQEIEELRKSFRKATRGPMIPLELAAKLTQSSPQALKRAIGRGNLRAFRPTRGRIIIEAKNLAEWVVKGNLK